MFWGKFSVGFNCHVGERHCLLSGAIFDTVRVCSRPPRNKPQGKGNTRRIKMQTLKFRVVSQFEFRVFSVFGLSRIDKPTIKEFNEYCKRHNLWKGLDGILFHENPERREDLLIKKLFHRKRIQVAVYNENIIHNFAFLLEEKCT